MGPHWERVEPVSFSLFTWGTVHMESFKVEELCAAFWLHAAPKLSRFRKYPKHTLWLAAKAFTVEKNESLCTWQFWTFAWELLTHGTNKKNSTLKAKCFLSSDFNIKKEAASASKVFSQRANQMLIKASLKHILLWTSNEWLTNLIHIFTLQTTVLPYTASTEKRVALGQCVC